MSDMLVKIVFLRILDHAWRMRPGPKIKVYASESLTIELSTTSSRNPKTVLLEIVEGETRIWFHGARGRYNKNHVYLLNERLGYQQELTIDKDGNITADRRRGINADPYRHSRGSGSRKQVMGSRL